MSKRKSEDSSINIGDGNTFRETVIGKYAKIEKHIQQDKSVTYSENKTNFTIIENCSIKLIEKCGEKKPLIFGVVSSISGIITIVVGFNSFLKDINNLSYTGSSIFNLFANKSIIIGLFLLIIGLCIISLIEYKYKSQCPKCKKYYTFKDFKDPIIREVKAHDGVKKTTTHFLRCNNCKFKDTISNTTTIPFEL